MDGAGHREIRGALELALARDQALVGIDDPNGLQLLNVHNAKGKQFDGAFALRESRHDGKQLVSNRVGWDDPVPIREAGGSCR